MSTLRERVVAPGQVVVATGRVRAGWLVPLGPRPTVCGRLEDHVELAGRLELIGESSQWEGRTITVAGEWDGVALHSPVSLPESAPPWFTTATRASHARETTQPWSDEDVRRALETVPDAGLLVTGEGKDGQGRRIALAIFVRATNEVIAWEESFPRGTIDIVTWLQPHPTADTLQTCDCRRPVE